MYEDTFRAIEYEPEVFRPAEVSAGQMFRFYDKHAAFRQGVICNQNCPAAERIVDCLP